MYENFVKGDSFELIDEQIHGDMFLETQTYALVGLNYVRKRVLYCMSKDNKFIRLEYISEENNVYWTITGVYTKTEDIILLLNHFLQCINKRRTIFVYYIGGNLVHSIKINRIKQIILDMKMGIYRDIRLGVILDDKNI